VSSALLGSLGLVVAGPFGAVIGVGLPMLWPRLRSAAAPSEPPITLVLLLLLISIRSGLSVLAALDEVAHTVPSYRNLHVVSRIARISGLTSAIEHADNDLRPVVAHLARAQRSGASLTGTVRRLLESRLATEKTEKIASARSLPVKLMIPVTLLMLPGMVLMLYAPTLLSMFDSLTGVLG